MYRGGLTLQSEPDPSTSQNAGRGAQYTSTGASTSNHVIGSIEGERSVSRKQGIARQRSGSNPLKAVKRGLQRFPHRPQPKTRRKFREFGEKVLKPFNDAFVKDVGIETRNHIRKASYVSRCPGYEGAKFLPRDGIIEILSKETVRRLLAKCDGYKNYDGIKPLRHSTADVEGQVASICDAPNGKSYRKMFIILVLLKKPSVIAWFIHQGICDDNLPLLEDAESKALKWTGMQNSDQQFPTGGLKPGFFTKFMEEQWLVLVPYFAPLIEKAPQRLGDKQIPPYTYWNLIRGGGYGEVFEVHIHPSQHGFKDTKAFAIKQIRQHRKKQVSDLEREHSIHRKFKNDKHEHMISILTAYIHNEVYNLVFPLALGDLLRYWKKVNPTPPEDERDVNLAWLAAQCQGLAEGLSSMHRYETTSFKCLLNPESFQAVEENRAKVKGGGLKKLRLFGRHGDIKPENILYYPGHRGNLRGRLLIADFGCAEFSTKEEVDPNRRNWIPNTPTYRAPETDLSPSDSSITPSYDIWALGCVYLEFLTWWFGGWALVTDFAEKRLSLDPSFFGLSDRFEVGTDFFFSITKENDKKTADVRESVKKFMDRLDSHKKSNDFSRKFLMMIRTKMLVIESQNGNGTKNGRASAMSIAGYIYDMRQNLPNGPPA